MERNGRARRRGIYCGVAMEMVMVFLSTDDGALCVGAISVCWVTSMTTNGSFVVFFRQTRLCV